MEYNRFTIIIPIHNAGNFLAECMESILAQTYKYWIAICVDDGSTDSSRDILQSYANRDGRISAYFKENGGAGSARNYALSKISQDTWISFVDSDDYISSTMYENINQSINGNNVDYIRLFCNTTSERYSRQCGTGKNTYQIVNRDTYFHKHDVGGQISSLLIKYSIVKKNRILFNENMKTLEDQLFSLQCALHSKSIMIFDRRDYYYYNDHNSITQKRKYLNNDIIICINEIYSTYRDIINNSKYIHHYFYDKWLPEKIAIIRSNKLNTLDNSDDLQKLNPGLKEHSNLSIKYRVKLAIKMYFGKI